MDRGTRRRASIAVIAAAALASGLGTPSRAGTPWDGCPRGIGFYGDHVTVAEPPYGSNPPTSSSLAADPTDLTRLAVTNGRQVFSSDDAGCTWSDAFPSTRPGQAGRVTVVAQEGTRLWSFVPVPHVPTPALRAHRLRLYLRDGPTESSVDLPAELPAGECDETRRCLVRFAPDRSLLVAYAVTPGVDGTLAGLGVSTDGGRNWTVRLPPAVDNKPVPIDDLAIDPEDDAHIVVIAGGRIFGSRDRGETWTALAGPTSLSPEARVLFTDRAVVVDGTVHVAGDDGSFADTGADVPGEPLRDVAYGPAATGHALVVAAAGGLYRQRADGGFDVLLRNAAGVSQVATTAGGLWVRRTGTLGFVDVTPGQLDGPPPPPRRGGITPPPDLRGKTDGGRLHVGGHVEVSPGGSAVTVITGDLSRQPRGLDVFFLMDTTGSMVAKVQPMALAMGRVVEALNREGVSARFGLGEYGQASFRYRRHADLGTPPAEVQAKLLALTGNGGDEYHYTSFYQLATGEGMAKVTYGGTVPPGQQASFQPGALHVVVHATDDIDRTDRDGPTEATALAALNAVDVRHIGIYPYDGAGGQALWRDPAVALRRYAEVTSTFTPAGGVDCDGDTVVDLHEGDPIACLVPASTAPNAPIADILQRLLLALAAIQPVEVVAGASPLEVDVRGLDDYSHVDLHEPHTGLEFRVQVQCPPAERGKRVDVPLHLHVGGVTVASAVLPVVCLPEPVEPSPPQPPAEEPPSPRRAAPRVVPGVPVVASAPTAVAQSTATAQAASQATSSAQATQVGMAVAPDDALQAATEEEDDAHFVAHSRPAPSPVPAAAALFAVAVGLLYAVRPRVACVRDGRGLRW